MHKLAQFALVDFAEMIFVGDALFPGGNDFPVREAGIDSIAVRDTEETKRVIETLLCSLPVRQSLADGAVPGFAGQFPPARAQMGALNDRA
jgi:hypothetical protein